MEETTGQKYNVRMLRTAAIKRSMSVGALFQAPLGSLHCSYQRSRFALEGEWDGRWNPASRLKKF